jgi:hypothetical protein
MGHGSPIKALFAEWFIFPKNTPLLYMGKGIWDLEVSHFPISYSAD